MEKRDKISSVYIDRCTQPSINYYRPLIIALLIKPKTQQVRYKKHRLKPEI